MDEPVLLGPRGADALVAAAAWDDPTSLAAGTALRTRFDPELAAAALTQTALRRKAVRKLGPRAGELYLTPDGLEQASRAGVAAWRARRLADAGVRAVVDLGCGVGADALAFADAGLDVLAVEIDPLTAAYARANLAGRGEVVRGDAVVLAGDLVGAPDARRAVFLDPARRTGAGRSWRLVDLRPSWDFVLGLLGVGHPVMVKLGPGFDPALLPPDIEACWVSDHGDPVELGLWRLAPGTRGIRSVVSLPSGVTLDDASGTPPSVPVAPVARYLVEPDGTVVRAGLLSHLVAQLRRGGATVARLDARASYLSGDIACESPFVTCFEVLESFAYRERALRAWVREHGVGALEIKSQGFDIDPATLRRKLRPTGRNAATVVLVHTVAGARVLVCRRVERGVDLG